MANEIIEQYSNLLGTIENPVADLYSAASTTTGSLCTFAGAC